MIEEQNIGWLQRTEGTNIGWVRLILTEQREKKREIGKELGKERGSRGKVDKIDIFTSMTRGEEEKGAINREWSLLYWSRQADNCVQPLCWWHFFIIENWIICMSSSLLSVKQYSVVHYLVSMHRLMKLICDGLILNQWRK